jgi:hypothetical protein
MSDGSVAKTIQAHPGGVLSVAFTHDGRLVSCGRDGQVKLWKPDGSQIKTFERFGDIALRAAASYDDNRVVAGDFTGAIRVWTIDDGKRAGDLTANPPTVADQLAGFDQRLKELGAAATKATAELKDAQTAADNAAAELKAANEAQAAATRAIAAAEGQLKTVTAEVANKSKTAREALPAKQSAASAATQAHAKAKAALESAVTQLASLKSKLSSAKSAAQEAEASLERGKERAKAKPDDKDLAAKVEAKTKAVEEQRKVVEETNKHIAARNEEVKNLTLALTKADNQAKAAAQALNETKTASRVTVENSPEVAKTKEAIAKAKKELESATKLIAARTPAVKSTGERLARAKVAADAAGKQLDAAKGQRTRLEAALNKQPAKVSAR